MKNPFTLTISEPHFAELYAHLFPGDGDEHGAVITAGVAETPSGTRLLVRDVFLAEDGTDFVAGTVGYRAFTPEFIVDKAGYCADQRLAYLTVHCHGGRDGVALSPTDLASHERGYPALLDITNGMPVGGLVFAENVVAGDIWTKDGRATLDHMTVLGRFIRNWYPRVKDDPVRIDPIYDRQTRIYGDVGQKILSNLKIGIIGLGGGGSLINEWCARLGVGEIVAVDFDKIEPTNVPRVVGSTHWDAKTFLIRQKSGLLQAIGTFFAKRKLKVAERVAKQANSKVRFRAIHGDVLDERIAKSLADMDFIFLCTDNMQSRLVFNAIVHQYLIPGIQVGVHIHVEDHQTGKIGDITANTRLVFPHSGGGCLLCSGDISRAQLQEETLTREELKRQRYVDDVMVHDPSVVTLNVLSAAQAANDLMMIFTGLYTEDADMGHQMHFVRDRLPFTMKPHINERCTECGSENRSRRARGDSARLPCRIG